MKMLKVTLVGGEVRTGVYFKDMDAETKLASCGINADRIFDKMDVFIADEGFSGDDNWMRYVPRLEIKEVLPLLPELTFEDALSIVLAVIRCPKCMGCAQNICPNGNTEYGRQFDCATLRSPEMQALARKVIKKGL